MVSIEECLSDGSCKATFFKMEGCSFCPDMKEQLDRIGIKYDEQEVTKEVLDELQMDKVPFLVIDNELTGERTIVDSKEINRLKEELYY